MTGKGFLASMFDFSFTAFVTTKLIRYLYIAAVCLAGLGALVMFIVTLGAGFRESALAGVGSLVVGFILSPLLFLLAVVYARVALELTVVIFRIAEHTADIAEAARGQSSVGTPPVTG